MAGISTNSVDTTSVNDIIYNVGGSAGDRSSHTDFENMKAASNTIKVNPSLIG